MLIDFPGIGSRFEKQSLQTGEADELSLIPIKIKREEGEGGQYVLL
jgi:hypothetical protein